MCVGLVAGGFLRLVIALSHRCLLGEKEGKKEQEEEKKNSERSKILFLPQARHRKQHITQEELMG